MLNSTLTAARQRITRTVANNGGILRLNDTVNANAVDVLHALDEEGFISLVSLESSVFHADMFKVSYDVQAVLA